MSTGASLALESDEPCLEGTKCCPCGLIEKKQEEKQFSTFSWENKPGPTLPESIACTARVGLFSEGRGAVIARRVIARPSSVLTNQAAMSPLCSFFPKKVRSRVSSQILPLFPSVLTFQGRAGM